MQYTYRMQKFQKLKNIADVITGYTFRGAIEESPTSSLYVLQAKNIKDDLFVNVDLLTPTELDTSHTKAFIKDGDVVMSARGSFRCSVVRSDKKILTSSSVYLLRINQKDVLSEYLAAYLNSSAGRSHLSQVMTGAAIKLILRKDLEGIRIPIISIAQQEAVVALYKNIKKQENLLNKKNQIQKNIMNGIFQKIVED